jgi:hypothetical protein
LKSERGAEFASFSVIIIIKFLSIMIDKINIILILLLILYNYKKGQGNMTVKEEKTALDDLIIKIGRR